MTGNQLVAHNLRRAREHRGLTQEQAAELLEPYLGERWSPASFSAAERSAVPGKRAREFTADELLAFMRAFELPLVYFLMPPVDAQRIEIGRASITVSGLISALLPPESKQGRLLEEVRQTIGQLHLRLGGPVTIEEALARGPRRKPKEEKSP